MATVVVPFRSSDPKRRLEPLPERDRARLAAAMLADVLAAVAAAPAARVFVVAPELPELPAGMDEPELVPDPRHGQGAAVRAALDAAVAVGAPAPYLVLNSDLPCATPRDVLALAGAVPDGGLALVRAADGTTNALAFSDERLFEPLYGPGSAERYAALAPARLVDAPNLVDDVDTLDDLMRLTSRLGEHTLRLLAELRVDAAA
ncbi:MAG: NTP transferase domain-containing protein [Gaiellaceae bacterium]